MTDRKNQPLPVIHPFLFCLYPVIALFALNIDQLRPNEVYRSLIIIFLLTAGSFFLIKLLIRNWQRAGIICSLGLLLFFSYGHVYVLFANKGIPYLSRADVLAILWAVAFINLAWLSLRKLRKVNDITRFLNIVSIIALIFPVYQIIAFAFTNRSALQITSSPAVEKIIAPTSLPATPPDIYYIIVDGYGRADILQELYHYDNSRFLDFLRAKGFYIASESHPNYGQTALSLASSLNMQYMNDLAAQMGPQAASRAPLAEMVQHSQIRSILSQAGYQIVNLASGYTVTEMRDADQFFSQGEKLTSFETTLASGTASVLILDKLIPLWYREQLQANLNILENLPATGSPRFVFGHILMPHPPFVFGPHGEFMPSQGFREGNYFAGTTDDYIRGYTGQMTYLNQRLERIITHILETSPNPPVIILQGDHGAGAFLNWDTVELTCIEERFSILNAYYFPDGNYQRLYPTISPVNSFRVILDTYFNTRLGRLPDYTYYATWAHPYNLVDITPQLDTCNRPTP